ncbi:hypothetical protein ABZ511_24755 [Nocardia gamkensis]
MAAFQVSAVLNAVDLALRLGDETSMTMARRVIDGLLDAAA